MKNLQKRDQEINNIFLNISSWEEKYKKIIELGKEMPLFPKNKKIAKWLVKGCQSEVWLYPEYSSKENNIYFYADSTALITKGLVALLLRYYSGLSPKQILAFSVPLFLKELKLQEHLTPTRVGGLFSMIKQIQYYAYAYKNLKN